MPRPSDPSSLLRRLPSVDRLLQEPGVAALVEGHGRSLVVEAVRDALGARRQELLAGAEGPAPNGTADLVEAVRANLAKKLRFSLRPAINATGVVLHTGLGRARLAPAAAEAVLQAVRSHALLEVDPATGDRGDRQEHVVGLLRQLTGAEAALVVNNNAAAVFLTLHVLAAGREVVISRGQLVEIGGSFRIPDVIRAAGAELVEVGTTNRVRLGDYRMAIGDRTALLLYVHPSNYRVVGFTAQPELEELVALGREAGLPVMVDLGSGALVDLREHGLPGEPPVWESVRAGADLTTFSGDKLLGGPQAGILVGSEALLSPLRRHPMMRVLRPDKMTLAALEATLRLYLDPSTVMSRVPTLAALAAPADELAGRARRLAGRLEGSAWQVKLESGASQVGGGALPGENLLTTLISLALPGVEVGRVARTLREGEPSVWGRVRQDRVLLDLRTVQEEELEPLAAALLRVAAESSASAKRNGA